MGNARTAFLATITDPAYWCIAALAGLAPFVVPAPYGYILGILVAVALVSGLARLDRLDARDLPEATEAAPGAHMRESAPLRLSRGSGV